MHAVQIRASIDVGEQTERDPRGALRRLTLRRRGRRAPERPEREPEREPEPVRHSVRTPAPRGGSRLSDLRVHESIHRSSARRRSTFVRSPSASSDRMVSGIEIAWVRCDDTHMSAYAADGDGLLLEGRASGEPRARRGGARSLVATLSVGIDTRQYTVEIRAGDTAANVARKLSSKLSDRFVVELDHTSTDSSILRLRRERFGR